MSHEITVTVPKGTKKAERVWFETSSPIGLPQEKIEAFGKRLIELARPIGVVTSEMVLADAVSKKSVFHEWVYCCADDEAAHRYRLHRAREIIGKIIICEQWGSRIIKRKAFMNLTLIEESIKERKASIVGDIEERQPQRYNEFLPIADATTEQINAWASRELHLWVERYKSFPSCRRAIELIQQAMETLK